MIRSAEEQALMRRAGRVVAEMHEECRRAAKPGAIGVLAPHQVTHRVGERVTIEFRVARIERRRDGVTHIYASDPNLKDEKFRLVVPFAVPRDLMTALTQRGYGKKEAR